MPSPELKSDAVWSLHLPPLSDVRGEANLDTVHLPEHLAGIPERIFEAVDHDRKLILLLRQPKQGDPGAAPQAGVRFEDQADLFQLVHRGLRRNGRMQGFAIVSPDDRDPDVHKNAAKLYEALYKMARAIEEGSGHDAGEQLLKWIQKDRGQEKEPRGAVITLFPEIVKLVGREKATYLWSKLRRLFPAAQLSAIEVPHATENLYTGWEKHILGARVDECRRLLEAAMASPVQEEGVLPRACRFPDQLSEQADQKEAVQAILRQLQRLMIAPGHLLLTGERGVGKTTLAAGAYQLARQLGFGAHYTCWDAAKAKELGKELAERGFLNDRSGTPSSEDRFLSVDQADMGVSNGDQSLGLYSLDRQKFETLAGLRKVLEARAKRLAPRARMLMTSNLPFDQMRKAVQQSLAGHAAFYDPVNDTARIYRATEKRPQPPDVCTLGYLLGEQVLGETLRERNAAPFQGQSPTTYAEFTGRLHVVPLGGEDWGNRATGGLEWNI